MKDLLIFIPTYNEAENVKLLFNQLLKTSIKADILFLDDNSPDGTSNIIKEICKTNKNAHLIVRRKKLGIGSAHKDGINWAYNKGYKTLVTMDSDFTHNPSEIINLLKYHNKADVIVASRYLHKNGITSWNLFRKTLAFIGHFLTTTFLKMPFDATGAFRLYRLDKIPRDIFGIVQSDSYSFFFESLYILHLNQTKIKEVAIKLSPRTYGSSKMSYTDAWNSLKFLFETFIFSFIYSESYIFTPKIVKANKKRGKTEKEWDDYWLQERKKRKVLYDFAAVFYRKYIIKRTLNYFIKKTFPKNSILLHAGSGAGQVDADLVNYAHITALDISSGALNRYKAAYKDKCSVLYGSIFKIPVKKDQFEGIYNLGVMEHFTKEEIEQILKEFRRVLKKNGKIVLFWPPAFGLSVIFLNTMHFILNDVLGKKIRLHPEEITKVTSRRQIINFLKDSGFELESFNFGYKDLFTYVVIIGKKI